MGEEKGKVSFGFRLFVIAIEVIIASAILGGAWLIDKLLVAPPLVVAFRLTRVKIETKYDVYHCATILACMFLTSVICVFGSYISLPIAVSLISNIIVGVGFAMITWHIQDIIDLKSKYTRKERLLDKCKELNYGFIKTQIAVQFFIDKKKTKEVWHWLCDNHPQAMTWDSLYNLKSKMKKDLF
jgi:hypothetical protein